MTNGKPNHLELWGDDERVEEITGLLMESGFEYDVDFETLYGAGWKIVGLRITARHAEIVRLLDDNGYLQGEV